MVDNDNPAEPSEEFTSGVNQAVAEPDVDILAGIITDGLVGAVGGLVGTAAMTIGLFVASTLGAFDMQSFATLADLTGLVTLFPGNDLTVGYLIFLAGGMVTWPLLFVATAQYLPGSNYAMKGLPYGFVLWTGFVLAFADGIASGAVTLALYALLTLVSHFAYGFTLGAVFDYLSDRPDTLV